MEHRDILYSKWQNDECYTPDYAVRPILKYLPKDKIIWCPFDKEESNFVKILKEEWYKVVFSHIDYWQDFFEYEPEEWDMIVSNPPFTNKRAYFERAIKLQKPFALIMTNTWLNDSAPKRLFKENNIDMELLMFDRRIRFINPNGESMWSPTFSSSYYCHWVLPKQIIIEYLDIKK